MKNRHALLLFALLTHIACAEDEPGGLDAGPAPDATVETPIARGVVIETLQLDFGAVVLTSTDTASFTVRNDNDDPVRVTITEPMGGAADRFSRMLEPAGTGGRIELGAGESITVTVSVSPARLGPVSTNLLVEACLGECPTLVEVLAEGVASGLDCTAEVDFELVFPGQCATRTIPCTNVGNANEVIGQITLDDDGDGTFELAPIAFGEPLQPGESLDLQVEFCPDEAEAFEGSIVVDTAGEIPTSQTITLLGGGGGPLVSCTPSGLAFGAIGIGGQAVAAVTCYNDGFDEAVLEPSVGGGAGFTVAAEPVTIEANRFGVIEVAAAADATGALQDTLTITTNDGSSPEITVALSAEGVMAGACVLEIAPSAVDFGIVNTGDLRAAPVRIKNTGQGDCLMGQAIPTLRTDLFGARNGPAPGTVLAAGETTVVEVTFAPTESAVFEGAVDITVQNPGSNRFAVMLRGQGGPAGLVPEPSALDFGAVPASCAEPVLRTITMRRISDNPIGVNNLVIDSDVPGVFTLVGNPQPTQLDFYETVSIQVGFQPAQEGLFSGELRVFYGLPNPIIVPLVGEARAVNQRIEQVDVVSPKVDLLFVVDDSGGNTAVQAALADAMPAFAARLQARQADFHFGVVTTDMEAGNRSGRLIGAPAVVDANTADLATVLAERVVPGTEGAGVEQGLAAAVAALSPPLSAQDNAGFRRPDAELAVVFISSEDDQSPNLSPEAVLETFRRASRGQRLLLAALVGPPAGECTGPSGSAVASPRYSTVIARHEDSLLLPYCQDTARHLDSILDRLLGGAIALTGTPVIDQISVSIGGSDVPRTSGQIRNWGYDLAGNAIVFFDAQIDNGDTIEVSYPLLCVPGTCGDTMTDVGEFCDDGNDVSTDACIDCRNATCGDGITWTGTEECDDGNLADDDACLTSCVAARCGDGIVQAGVELCDDGNNVNGDACPATCRLYESSGLQAHSFEALANGSPLTFSDDDDGRTSVQLPFSVDILGVPTSSLAVSINGFVSTQSIDPAQSVQNAPIPDGDAPNSIIAVWWDDLVLDTTIPGGAATSTATLGTEPNRQYIIEWRDLRSADHSSNNHRRWTFQLVLEETTNVLRFRYANTETRGRVPTAVTASAGVEDATGDLGVEVLGCSPNCIGPSRTGNRPAGFPQQTEVVLTP